MKEEKDQQKLQKHKNVRYITVLNTSIMTVVVELLTGPLCI